MQPTMHINCKPRASSKMADGTMSCYASGVFAFLSHRFKKSNLAIVHGSNAKCFGTWWKTKKKRCSKGLGPRLVDFLAPQKLNIQAWTSKNSECVCVCAFAKNAEKWQWKMASAWSAIIQAHSSSRPNASWQKTRQEIQGNICSCEEGRLRSSEESRWLAHCKRQKCHFVKQCWLMKQKQDPVPPAPKQSR